VFSDDGRRLASSSLDRTVRVWDVESRALITTLSSGGAYALGFSSDGRLGIGALNGEVTLWSLREPHVLAQADAGEPIVGEVSADGSVLVSASRHGVATWDVENLRQLTRLSIEMTPAVSLSPDRQQLAIPRVDEPSLELRAYPDGTLVAALPTSSAATCVAHAPDSSILAAGTSAGRIHMWRRDGTVVAVLEGHRDEVTSVRFSSDGGRLYSTSADGSARVWDLVAARELARNDATNWIVGVAESASTEELVTAGADGVLRIHDRTTMAVKRTLVHHDALVAVAVSHRDSLLAASTIGGTVHVWDAARGAELSILRVAGAASRVAFSSDGERLIATTDQGAIVAWEVSLEHRSPSAVTAFVECHDPYRLDGTRLLELPRTTCEPAISSARAPSR
jgi:WD40 repeat protein